ncbi:MAG: alanine--tRNA ligase [Nitrososphaerales archaeon]
MPQDKELLRKRFSAEPDKYYRVALFNDLGFLRKQCPKCGGFFWTLDEKRVNCPEQPCQQYEFLGSPATKEKVDYVTAWRKVESFFQKNGHQPVSRYPVVCRWRPDLYFTIASIVDFQRIESGKVVFDFPFNPLIVPQICLRFSDIANVGVTGRHYTSFCMIGQHALANAKGYWKDRCIELDFKLLTEEFGIDKKEVVFKEDVWLGPGAFGNSLEYYVRGLELGNAVFTGFDGTPENYKEYPEKVIDMGAGLERFVWATQGTFNSYDAVFAPVLEKLRKRTGLAIGSDRTLDDYFKLAGSLDIDQFKGAVADYSSIAKQLGMPEEELRKKIEQIQAVYSIVDHTRTLLFGISDGMLPGNVGGGYNLRVILRRSLDFLSDLGLQLDLTELASWHAESLKDMYPELREHVNDVGIILEVEEKKYTSTRERASKIIESMSRKKQKVKVEKLVELYDSDGITPDVLKKAGLDMEIPADFYNRITSRHMIHKDEGQGPSYDTSTLPETKLIFYEDSNQYEFRANVLKILSGDYVVLDSTAFYARAGGQEPDHGTISGLVVDDAIKVNNVILHHVKGVQGKISEGDLVEGIVDSRRRSLITRHHTATHIVNGASRKVLGPWVWQHSAFKDVDMGRLDITHFAHLTRDQIVEIERVANEVVRMNLPITITWFPRSIAEQKYGFRLYQGGAAPVKDLRIVNIEGFDVEACGGTHVKTTGEVGLIKIIKSERVQDGVERLEYVAGEVAINYVEKQESILLESSAKLETPAEKLSASISNMKADSEIARKNAKQLAKRLADLMISEVPKLSQEIGGGVSLYASLYEEGLDSEYHLIVGDKLCETNPTLVYVAIFEENSRTRIILFSGEEAQKKGAKAGLLVREIAKSIGGSGGGDPRFAQGGADKRPDSIPDLRAILLNSMTANPSKP